MLTDVFVVVAGLLWLGMLFGTALWAEKKPALLATRWPWVYSLSLAVYCTSWTFYGTVTQAQRSGWPIPPTFIGSILLYAFAFPVVLKLFHLAREQNSTSIADLIATRLGRSSWLAAAVTFVAVIGMVPYIALQLKAVAMSYGMLTRASQLTPPPWQDSALYVALAMALFAMLFGTRRASAAEQNRGLVLAMALESLLKLGAMLALGAFVWFGLDLPSTTLPIPNVDGASGFPALIGLGALAMFTLPHQFHVGVVECRDPSQLRTARWLFPLYMLLIALPILPLARAGDALLAPQGVPSDLYVLALPLSQGNEALALFAFLGGLSAATGMVIISTLALSVMIGNHWLTPLLVRGAWTQRSGGDLRGAVLMQRRVGILAVVLLAWAYSRAIAGNDALADIGAVSFSGLATLAPALAFAIWRPQTPPRAVLIGLLGAVLIWAWALLVPALVEAAGPASWLQQGPFGLSWLAPDQLAGLQDWSRLGRAVVLSLFTGSALTALASSWFSPEPAITHSGELSYSALKEVASRFLPAARVQTVLSGMPDETPTLSQLEQRVERELAAVVGAASARLLLNAARREQGQDLDTVAAIVGEASQALRFNQRVLEAALQNMSQGISVVDSELRLVAWNRRYAELFDYPENLLRVGVPIAELVSHNIGRGMAGDGNTQSEVQKRVSHMLAGTPYVAERRFGDSMVEIRGNPMPGGGFVATFTDVTDYRHAETELKRVAETLEQRVVERTAQLAGAKGEAERANRAKTRFLAAVSHDLAQPLNAAHLFTHALAQKLEHEQYRGDVGNIDGALNSAESLLAGLMDISRLDAGGMAPKIQPFCIDDVLQHLAAEFRVLAREKNLELHCVPSSAWVRSDPQLLRRVLQNFLANAVRYTEHGRVLLGCRRHGNHLRIEVWDTGPGIAEKDQTLIFEEFRRLNQGGQGLGLGLSIAERIANLLGHKIGLRSRVGYGTVFALDVPRIAAQLVLAEPAPVSGPEAPHSRVLVVDNDPDVLRAMQVLLSGWRCEVLAARTADEAELLVETLPPDLMLLDYHLDANLTGLVLRQRLTARIGERPTVVITADHSEAVRQAVAASGCQLLHKPLKPLALKSVMNRLLTSRDD
ncbi:MAG TPA: PAS-domain containing protein [Arenimonas sp.]|nr:PAS-domain containing protein [Arenimonas sp.]HOZ03890.1 PAS-domain containing protein [Arenimonas sp.]HPW32858.1 PAS-domain containing protein [Arenimonas sp.]